MADQLFPWSDILSEILTVECLRFQLWNQNSIQAPFFVKIIQLEYNVFAAFNTVYIDSLRGL